MINAPVFKRSSLSFAMPYLKGISQFKCIAAWILCHGMFCMTGDIEQYVGIDVSDYNDYYFDNHASFYFVSESLWQMRDKFSKRRTRMYRRLVKDKLVHTFVPVSKREI